MSIRSSIKKYRYLANRKIAEYSHNRQMSKLSKTFDYSKYEYSPLNVNELPYPTDWSKLAEYKGIILEIGCGHGELLQYLVITHPETLCIGFEIFKKYFLITNNKIKNSKNGLVFKADGYDKSINLFTDNTIEKVYVLFPDPWHKKKHHKRRPLVEKWFRDISKKLIDDGEIIFATDWTEYYGFVKNEFDKVLDIYEIETDVYTPGKLGLVETHYYKKWMEAGREFNYIVARKK